MTLDCNGLDHADWTWDEMEERAVYLAAIGRAVPPEKWVTAMVRGRRYEAVGAFLSGLA